MLRRVLGSQRERCIDNGVNQIRLAFNFQFYVYASLLGLCLEEERRTRSLPVYDIDGLIQK